MPFLFSYGTLQQASVQLSTFGRHLEGHVDALVGFERSLMTIDDPEFVKTSGKSQHPIVRFTGRPENAVNGVVFEISESELVQADAYEPAGYRRIMTTLRSGKRAWVYADARGV